MAAFQVTASELRTKAENLRSTNSQFKTQVGNLENQEKSLASMWEGDAKTAFHTAFNNDKVQMDNFYNLIEQYCAALENIAAQYEKTEMMNTDTASTRAYRI